MDKIQSIKQRFEIIGNDSQLNRAIGKAIRVSPTDISVLVTGESGVGKESIPRIIHQLSLRKHGKFIAVNCGAIPEGTIDSELFGHEKGAFTGATSTRSGYFEEYESAEIKWVSINSALLLSEEEINSNKKAQENFENKKALEMIEAENEIFDDYYEGPRGIAGEIYSANDGDVVKIEPDTYYEVLHLEDLQNLTLDFTGVELLTKEDVAIFTLENCSNIKNLRNIINRNKKPKTHKKQKLQYIYIYK